MRRRALLKLIALGALPLPAGAQQPGKVRRIGFFYGGSRQSALETGRYAAFLQGMRELGYVENKDYVIVARYSDGPERTPALAMELLDAKVDVIVASGGPPAQALLKSTTTMPIVLAVSVDPVRDGFAQTMAHPGRNFTGLSAVLADIFPKHVELIKAARPRISRLAILVNPRNASHPALAKRVEAAAHEHKMRPQLVQVSSSTDLEPAFADMAGQRAEALLVLGDSFFVQHFRQIAGLAIKHRMISTYSGREYPDLGGYMSYGPSFRDHYRRTARFVDKILKGAKPGDLPFEQPTKFELVINRSTAKALGERIPDELVLRADAVID
jgi:putative ABC transport system substrate-binding protein